MIKLFYILLTLVTIFNKVICDDLLVYNKIIKWYEKNQNTSWSGIYFNTDINFSTSSNLIKNIYTKISMGEKNVFIVLNTNGGDLVQTYQIINQMDLTRANLGINYHCISIKTYSSGFFIFQLCDYRYWIDGISKMMTHEPKINIEGTFKFVNNYVNKKFFRDYQNYNFILERIYYKSDSKLNKEIYEEKIANKDWIILSGFDTRFYNFADFYFIFVEHT